MEKKKVRNTGAARKRSSKSVEKTELGYDDDEDELFEGDETVVSASEDEGGSGDERKHRKLLEAICSLGGKKRRKLAERSEASLQVSEFTISAEGAGEKISLSDVLVAMEQAPTSVIKTKKQLKNLRNRKDTLELPLSRQQAEKIQREVAYKKTTNDVSQWQSLVNQNRRAEQLIFPLNREPSGPKRAEEVVMGWKAQTPLEQEIFKLLNKNMQPVNDPILTPLEEASLQAMSLEEAKIRRAELQKARALQSYYEAKARRDRKIKSKKYHKVLKKAKRKEFQKEFEEMCKTDPVGALEELKKMELARMQERMSLKHQNSGKWAKSKAIMAKYDDEARKAMQEQLEMNKALTQKLAAPSDIMEEEEEEEQQEAEVLPDSVNDAQLAVDPANPWMMGKLSAEPKDPERGDDEAQTIGSELQEEEEVEDEDQDEEEALLREFEEKRKIRQSEEDGCIPSVLLKKETLEKEKEEAECSEGEDGDEAVSEFNSLFRKLVKKGSKGPLDEGVKPTAKEVEREEPVFLDEGLTRVRTMEDMDALLSQDVPQEDSELGKQTVPVPEVAEVGKAAKQKSRKKRSKIIDCNNALTKGTKVLEVPLVPTVIDEEDVVVVEDQKMIIKEAFAGDDVVSDFLKDKRQQEEAGRPKVVDLTLPGWGEWGGVGLKPSRNKRKRFRVKVEPPAPRKDEKLPNVIISEKRNAAIAAHQVVDLPFPFQNPKQFEHSISMPVGSTWNTPRVVQKLTAPKVITQLGAIIEPMSKENLNTGNKGDSTRKPPDLPLCSGPGHDQKGLRKKGRQKHSGLKAQKTSAE